jgi:hypothetical protein
MKKAVSDEWYTPRDAVLKIVDIVPKDVIVWCPFDTEDSEFVKELQKTNKVVYSHIEQGGDFFEFEPTEWDIMISNPPYSIRNRVLERAFSFKKPFALLMNTNGIFDSSVRWDMFTKNEFSLMYIKKRVNYSRTQGVKETTSPAFQSAYVCSGMFDRQIVFSK